MMPSIAWKPKDARSVSADWPSSSWPIYGMRLTTRVGAHVTIPQPRPTSDDCRTVGAPGAWHVRHDSAAQSPITAQANDFKPAVAPLVGEPVLPKRTNNAFIGTDLEARLRAGDHKALVVVGVITNSSVDATVRLAGNLELPPALYCRWLLQLRPHRLEWHPAKRGRCPCDVARQLGQ
jgi:hypothetical protein